MEDFTIVRGSIASDGNIKAGKGFRVVHEEEGLYVVLFDTPYSSRPTVVVTQNYPGGDDFSSDGGNTKDNAVIVAIRTDRFKVKTGSMEGDRCSRAFEFIAIG